MLLSPGMHRGLRDLPGGGARKPGDGALRAVPRGAHGVCRRLQHGQDHDRGQRGHLRHDRGGRAGVRGRLAPPLAHHAPPAPAGAREDAESLLRRTDWNPEPQRAAVLPGDSGRVRQAARVGSSVGVQCALDPPRADLHGTPAPGPASGQARSRAFPRRRTVAAQLLAVRAVWCAWLPWQSTRI